jgi:hypothetical protein
LKDLSDVFDSIKKSGFTFWGWLPDSLDNIRERCPSLWGDELFTCLYPMGRCQFALSHFGKIVIRSRIIQDLALLSKRFPDGDAIVVNLLEYHKILKGLSGSQRETARSTQWREQQILTSIEYWGLKSLWRDERKISWKFLDRKISFSDILRSAVFRSTGSWNERRSFSKRRSYLKAVGKVSSTMPRRSSEIFI